MKTMVRMMHHCCPTRAHEFAVGSDFYHRMWADYFRYPAIRAPVLFLFGEDDNVTPYTFVEEQLGR